MFPKKRKIRTDEEEEEEEENKEIEERTFTLEQEHVQTKNEKGTRKLLLEYFKKGVVKEGQSCSLQRKAVHGSCGVLQCVLRREEGIVNIVPCKDPDAFGDKPAPHGHQLTKIYSEWFCETELYKREKKTPLVVPNHFYELIHFHYALHSHRSFMMTVAIADLHMVEDLKREWLPILFRNGSRVIYDEEDPNANNNGISAMPSALPMSVVPAAPNAMVKQNNNNDDEDEEEKKEKKKKKKEDKTWFRVRLALFSHEDTPDSPVMHTVHNESSFPIEDETLYGIELHNRMSGKSAAAAVYIDGRLQGEFLLRPKQRFILERPKNETRRFLFLRRGVPSASSSIYIRLVPERVLDDKVIVLSRTPHLSPHTLTSTTESHTFLSEHSTQQFSPPLLSMSFNEAAATTLHFQLVCTTSKYTNVMPLVDCRALPLLTTITKLPM